MMKTLLRLHLPLTAIILPKLLAIQRMKFLLFSIERKEIMELGWNYSKFMVSPAMFYITYIDSNTPRPANMSDTMRKCFDSIVKK